MEKIEAAMRAGRWTEGQQACREALMQRPTDARLHGYEGICFFRLGDFASAEPCFMRASALDPKFVDAGVKRAQCLDRLRRYDEALAVAREWQPMRPNDPALCAIIEAHQYRANPRRTEGWEISAATMGRAHLASEV